MKYIAWALLVVGLSGPATASTLRVPSEYSTIQEAVDAAASGDEILLASGEYSGPGNTRIEIIGIDLVLRSESGPRATRIAAPPSDSETWAFRVVLGTGNAVTISGIGFEFLAGRFGAAISASGQGVIRVQNCDFMDCESPATNGSESGGAVLVDGEVDAAFLGCRFLRNIATRGGGLSIQTSAPVTIDECTFRANSGGGLWLGRSSSVSVLGSQFNNHGGKGALVTEPGNDVSIERSLFVSNSGISLQSASVRNCTFTRNHMSLIDGPGGVLQILSGPVTLDRCIVRGNCANSGVADIMAYGPLFVTCCAVDSSGISGWEHIVFDGPQVWEDPMFCDPEVCGLGNDGRASRYELDIASPCSALLSPCGDTIGVYEVGCGDSLGACCVQDICTLLPANDCEDAGGGFLGEGTACEPNPCFAVPVVKKSWGEVKRLFR